MEGKDIALGTNYFMEGSGKCNIETSSDVCKGKKRYVYVRNIPTGTIPPLNLSFYNATGCNLTGLTEGRGLIPGLVEDVYDFNPVAITRAITKNGNIGSDTCKEMTLPVGYKIYDKDRENSTWKWETRCTSGHHTMTESTDKSLNNSVKNRNKNIKNARLPGPLQLRENFKGRKGGRVFTRKSSAGGKRNLLFALVLLTVLVIMFYFKMNTNIIIWTAAPFFIVLILFICVLIFKS
jgi:hypothetical protein